MTTATKFGAEELSGNLNLFQQVIPPQASNNIVAAVNFVNKTSSDARIRLAITENPLLAQSVTSTQGTVTFPVSSTSSSGNVITAQSVPVLGSTQQQPYTIGSTTQGSSVANLAGTLVTATATGTNLITCVSTGILTLNAPVTFNASVGNLISGTVYYVLSIPSSTTFTVSTIAGGPVFALANATVSSTITVNLATTGLTVGQQLTQSGQYLGSFQTIQIGSTSSGSNTITTATIPIAGCTTSVLTILGTPVYGTFATTNTVQVASTSQFYVGQPVQFQGTAVGNLSSTTGLTVTTYWIQSILNATQFTVSAFLNGPQVTLTTAVASSQLQVAPANNPFQVHQPVVFSNATIATSTTNIVAGTTYYVQQILNGFEFTITATLASSAFTLAVATINNLVNMNVQAVVSTTVNLPVNTPIMFNGQAIGNIYPNVTYYVQSVASATTFTVATTPGGAALALTSGTQSGVPTTMQQLLTNTSVTGIGIQPTNAGGSYLALQGSNGSNQVLTSNIVITGTTATTNLVNTASFTVSAGSATTTINTTNTAGLVVGMPVVFSNTSNLSLSLGSLIFNQVYWIQAVVTNTSISVTQYPGGSAFNSGSVASGVTFSISTLGLVPGTPLVYPTGTQFGGLPAPTTVMYVTSVASSTQFSVSLTPFGAPIALSTASGTLTTFMATTNLAVNQPVQFRGVTSITGILVDNQTGTTTVAPIFYVKAIDAAANAFTVSATPGGTVITLNTTTGQAFYACPMPLQGQTSAVMQAMYQPLYLSNSSGITNSFSTQGFAVYSTHVTLNVVLCSSTAAFTIGMPIVFSQTIGNLVGGTVYYVHSIYSSQMFSVSRTQWGTPFALANPTTPIAWGSIFVNQATTNLTIAQPVTFTGTTFGGVTTNTTYYINTILPNGISFTVVPAYGQTVQLLTTATGTMNLQPAVPNMLSNSIPINNIASGTITTQSWTIVASNAVYNTYTTTGSTALMYVGMPITAQVTGTVFGGIATLGQMIYYVRDIYGPTTFTISATYGGPVFALSTTSGSFTFYAATSMLSSNTPLYFAGSAAYVNSAFDTRYPYFVKQITNPYTFTVSQLYGNTTVYTPSDSTVGTFGSFFAWSGCSWAGLPMYVQEIVSTTSLKLSSTPPMTISAVSSTGSLITVNSTAVLYVQQPIMFNSTLFANIGNIVPGTIYYVQSITSSTQFTISSTWNGGAFSCGNYTPSAVGATVTAFSPSWISQQAASLNVAPVTSLNQLYTDVISVTATTVGTNAITCSSNTVLVQGMPVLFTNSLGNLIANTVYYVANVLSGTSFTVSATNGGPTVTLVTATATPAIGVRPTTTNLTVGQPITFTGTAYNAAQRLLLGGTLSGTNSLVTASITISGTTTGTNEFTVSVGNTNHLAVGQPIVFFGTTFGGVNASTSTSSTVYYVQSIPTPSTFTVSATFGGAVYSLSTASGTMTAQEGVNNLVVGQAITFTTSISNIVAGATYYVRTVDSNVASQSSTTFTVSSQLGGQAVNLYTVTGTSTASFATVETGTTYYVQSIASPTQFTVSATATGPVLPQATVSNNASAISVTSSTATALTNNQPIVFVGTYFTVKSVASTILTITGTTSSMAANRAVRFVGRVYGSVATATTYYVKTIVSDNTLSLSATPGGAAINFGTVYSQMTMNVSNCQEVEPFVTYYVLANNSSSNSFTISATVGGAAITLTNKTGSMYATSNVITLADTSTTANLRAGQQVVFAGSTAANTSVGSLVPASNSSFGMYTITASTAAAASITSSATPAVLNSTFTMASTAGLVVGQPVTFMGSTIGGVTANTTYYIHSIVSSTTFAICTMPGGSQLALTAGTGAMLMIPAYYVLAVLNATQLLLTGNSPSTSQLTSITQNNIGSVQFVSTGTGLLNMLPLPHQTDFIESDTLVLAQNIVERTGILVPPNSHVYAASGSVGVNVLAVGIAESVA